MAQQVIELAQALIRKPSWTPDDAGCQALITERLVHRGFQFMQRRFGEVDNALWWHGEGRPAMLFLGHTDVVPAGDLADWTHDPLSGEVIDGVLHGRGAADMKGSVAAMVVALEQFVETHADHPGCVALMLTSDEEGEAIDGVRKFMPMIAETRTFDWCLVGEPTSGEALGDTVRVGRRGSLNLNLVIHGTQGHVAYPQLADNPIFRAAALLDQLGRTRWDEGNADFPPTSFQISNLKAGTGASNVIPGDLHITANFRYSPESTPESLAMQLQALLERHQLEHTLTWQLSGEPFYCQDAEFRRHLAAAIHAETGREPEFNTAGGTSDGRFVAPCGVHTMELGGLNATIHKVNECQRTDDLVTLERIYRRLLAAMIR